MAKRPTQTINGIYDNGTIQFYGTLKLGHKLPLRDRTPLHFHVELPVTWETFGILRVPKRLAKLIAEDPEFSILNS